MEFKLKPACHREGSSAQWTLIHAGLMKGDRAVTLSPPSVIGPISPCGNSVRVQNQLSGSTVAILRNGGQVAGGVAAATDQTFTLNSGITLNPGDSITATQSLGQGDQTYRLSRSGTIATSSVATYPLLGVRCGPQPFRGPAASEAEGVDGGELFAAGVSARFQRRLVACDQARGVEFAFSRGAEFSDMWGVSGQAL